MVTETTCVAEEHVRSGYSNAVSMGRTHTVDRQYEREHTLWIETHSTYEREHTHCDKNLHHQCGLSTDDGVWCQLRLVNKQTSPSSQTVDPTFRDISLSDSLVSHQNPSSHKLICKKRDFGHFLHFMILWLVIGRRNSVSRTI